MPLPTSGTISLQMLIAEFGGGMKLADFVRGGSLVPNIPINAAIPTALPLNLRQFLGAGAFQIGAPAVMSFAGSTFNGVNSTGFRLNTDGIVTVYQNGFYSDSGYRWAMGNFSPSLYEVQLTVTSGVPPTVGPSGWVNLSTQPLWYRTQNSNGLSTVAGNLVVRRISDAVVMSTSSVTIESERFNDV